MLRKSVAVFLTAMIVLPSVSVGNACTGISLTSRDSHYIQARTMEWGGENLRSKLIVSPQGYRYSSVLSGGEKGLSWQARYGFVGISVFDDRYIAEGINQEGLSAGLFYFKNYGSLSKYNPQTPDKNLADMDVVRWILTHFKTVREVREHIQQLNIVPTVIDRNPKNTDTVHWRVADRLGGNIIIEIKNQGSISIHENLARVITNSPNYEWHLTNLNNYINLAAGTVASGQINGVNTFSFGAGSRALGLPGDITPPSRFIRAAFYVNTTPELKNGDEAVSQAFHILNNFDIPVGVEYTYKHEVPELPSATQWTTVIDQNRRLLFYKTMNDSTVKLIDLGNIRFTQEKENHYPLDNGVFSFQRTVID